MDSLDSLRRRAKKINWWDAALYVTVFLALLLALNANTHTVRLPGTRGPAGASITGPQGALGVTGAAGKQGSSGSRGEAGQQGTRGVQGLSGQRGQAGSTGARGPAGSQGPPGPRGPRGFPGPRGLPGQTPSVSGIVQAVCARIPAC